jgi:predicted DsbA family dithiol-disulfide isomerase
VSVAELVFYSDVVCPWATVMVLRLRAARARAGAEDELGIVHRAYPLELHHGFAIPRRVVDAEIPLCASLAPDFGWAIWQGRAEEYPVTVLLALEAVRAADAQSVSAGEQLDLALRHAFFTRSRCISMRHEILALARTCDAVDVEELTRDLDSGTWRSAVTGDFADTQKQDIPCSGTIVMPDGTHHCNPGSQIDWIGRFPRGVPILMEDDPRVYDEMVSQVLE